MIGNRIAALRRAKGMSQQELATRARISMQNLSKIEQGRVSPRENTLAKIASALGGTVPDLYREPADTKRKVS